MLSIRMLLIISFTGTIFVTGLFQSLPHLKATAVILEVAGFILLVWVYIKLCMHREIGVAGKFIELVSLYGVSFWALLSNIKFSFWAAGIAVIGIIKLLTTKKKNIERRDKGFIN